MAAQLIAAAQYLRMSSEMQQYSLENQADAITQYAATNGFLVTKTFSDVAKSGVSCKHRRGLQELLRETMSGEAEFRAILVYDVSRWGRFQDVDEAAHYEYLCRDAGVPVYYCAELFPREMGLASSLLKAMKRSMAGEYSRELSIKIHDAKIRLARMGYQLGSYPPYGMRRLMIGPNGSAKQILEYGEWKSLQTDRVVLVPGPRDEIKVVQRIFREFTKEHRKPIEIARRLNADGLRNLQGSPWTNSSIIRTLRQAKYTGTQVWGKSRVFLQSKRRSQAPEEWVVCPNAFQPVIGKATFDRAQAEFASFTKNLSDDALIKKLEKMIQTKGRIDNRVIRSSCPCHWGVYMRRFGSLLAVYDRLFQLGHKDFLAYGQRVLMIKRDLGMELTRRFPEQLREAPARRSFVRLQFVRSQRDIGLHIAKCIGIHGGQMRWMVNLESNDRRRVTVIALLDGTNNHVRELVFFANLSHLDRVGPCIDFTHQVEWMKKGVVVGRRSNFQGLLLHLESASTV